MGHADSVCLSFSSRYKDSKQRLHDWLELALALFKTKTQ